VADGRGFHDEQALKAGPSPATRVYFVGAGPGHPDLLTVRAVECLGRAEVVVHDGLVPPALLEAVGCRAERMLVPRSVEGSDPGEATGRLLAELAATGRTIVRLKGGDPAVFGRLAEELQPLRDAGIPFEIVPGVTAALAAAAAAGVPLTSRQAASSLTILTGHEADEKNEGLDFSALAGLPGTLAIYMGVEQVQRWSQELISAGKPVDTPVTVISRCSWPDQRIAVTTLGECGAAFERSGWPSPAIVIVGDVAEPRPPQAQTPRPLAGRRILVTRPRGQGEDLAAAIAALGGECIHSPVIRIEPPASWEPLDRAIAAADTFDWIVFASANGVRSFVERLRAMRRDGRHLGTARLAAIGPSTAAALESAGLVCDLEPERSQSEGIVESLGHTVRHGRFLLVRADRGRDVMRREFEALGHHVTEVAAYSSRAADTIDPATLSALDRAGIDWITVTSSFIAESAARLFGDRMRRWKIASLSPVTSATLESLGLAPTVEAASPTAGSLAAAIATWESSLHSSQPAGATKNDQPPHSAATSTPMAG
jgi:uroporphyrinogen III methyltransferase/synthase